LKSISEYKKKIKLSKEFNSVNSLLKNNKIHTICHSALCPNIDECFSRKKLTFLILGDICTRDCAFCNVKTGKPEKVDIKEPFRIADIVDKLKLRYVVITSVTRDDLSDGGCDAFIKVVEILKARDSKIKIELLIPDFKGDYKCLEKIAHSDADVIGHNIETIKRLYEQIRPAADFQKSVDILKQLKELNPNKLIKTGFMVGLRETMEEIKGLLDRLYANKVDIITVGQYFQPSKQNIPVQKMYEDEDFKIIEEYGRRIGFKYINSGRFVRSSYYAEEVLK